MPQTLTITLASYLSKNKSDVFLADYFGYPLQFCWKYLQKAQLISTMFVNNPMHRKSVVWFALHIFCRFSWFFIFLYNKRGSNNKLTSQVLHFQLGPRSKVNFTNLNDEDQIGSPRFAAGLQGSVGTAGHEMQMTNFNQFVKLLPTFYNKVKVSGIIRKVNTKTSLNTKMSVNGDETTDN